MNRDPRIGVLTVIIGGNTVGTVTVTEQSPRKVIGSFTPGPQFESYRPIFEKAENAARKFDEASKHGCDDQLWGRLMQAYEEINRLHPSFAEYHVPIEEFAIGPDWQVEITLELDASTTGPT